MKELIPVETIEKRIYLIRGQKIMLDRDLAELYEVETRVLNQAVQRNVERFPEDFMFSLNREEIMRISQIVISSGDPEKAPLKFSKNVSVFTEQGVAMLSSVLNSTRAIQVNIAIMRTFVKLREMLSANKELAHKLTLLEDRIEKHDGEIKVIFNAIRQLMTPPETKKRKIGFEVRESRPRYGASGRKRPR
ncbi:MAG: ORF6N domain-containing protein [Nitrospirae bacterium]|nr:MAG: ORF6N domain-containing protein [Nitrospirota bacterium]